ncbi:unnamed protein product [Urochloa decumbens]|uniref:Transposase n=1 Tax=Urochloa decumbens TaxID=240449 RepID=A0ABC9FZI6_9POAL
MIRCLTVQEARGRPHHGLAVAGRSYLNSPNRSAESQRRFGGGRHGDGETGGRPVACYPARSPSPRRVCSCSSFHKTRMVETPGLHGPEDAGEDNWRSNAVVEEMFGRMALQITDYPGSGPNDRHTPKAPGP